MGLMLQWAGAESFCYLFPRTQNDGGGFLNHHCFPGAQGSGTIQHSHLKFIYFILIKISILWAIHICICSSIYFIALMCFKILYKCYALCIHLQLKKIKLSEFLGGREWFLVLVVALVLYFNCRYFLIYDL